jgi:hypothetical protein
MPVNAAGSRMAAYRSKCALQKGGRISRENVE